MESLPPEEGTAEELKRTRSGPRGGSNTFGGPAAEAGGNGPGKRRPVVVVHPTEVVVVIVFFILELVAEVDDLGSEGGDSLGVVVAPGPEETGFSATPGEEVGDVVVAEITAPGTSGAPGDGVREGGLLATGGRLVLGLLGRGDHRGEAS